jgi:hypothetical protein
MTQTPDHTLEPTSTPGEGTSQGVCTRAAYEGDIEDRLRACETRPLVTLDEESAGNKRDAAAWVELWKTLQDAAKVIEGLRNHVGGLEAAIETSGFVYRNTDSGPNLVRS